MIDGVSGVIIWTDDLEGMTEFYRDKLEFPVHSIRAYFVAFEWGDMRFSIGLHDEVKGHTSEPYRVMVNLGVRDIQSTYETLTSRGVEFVRSPEQEHWGGWMATLKDPDGNMLQLMQQPER